MSGKCDDALNLCVSGSREYKDILPPLISAGPPEAVVSKELGHLHKSVMSAVLLVIPAPRG